MNGRRRPSGVWNVSLQGPITTGSVSANRPSAREHERDQRRRVGEVAEERRQVRGRGGEREGEAEGAEAEDPDEAAARPLEDDARAPSGGRRRHARLDRGGRGRDREPPADDVHDGALRRGHARACELAEQPAGHDLLERAVEDRTPRAARRGPAAARRAPARRATIRSIASNACAISAISLLRAAGSAGDLAHEHAHEVGVARPRAEHDRPDLAQLLARAASSDSSTSRIAASSAVHVSRKIVSRSSSFEQK